MLVDGSSVAGNATVSAWMQNGHGYASSKLAGNAPIPWTILCNQPQGVCTGTVTGNVTQVFANGKQIGKSPCYMYIFDHCGGQFVLTLGVPQLFGVGPRLPATATTVPATAPLPLLATQPTRC
jgi:hypothetical protein